MTAAMSAFLFRMIMFVIGGWLFYMFDRRFGKRWYRRWYDLSHEHPLGLDVSQGFVSGRSGKTKCQMAFLVSAIFTVAFALSVHDTGLSWFFTFVFGMMVIIFSFMTAPLIHNLWGKREAVYETIDRMESGELNPADNLRETGRKISSRVSWLWDWVPNVWSGSAPSVAPAAPSPSDSGTVYTEPPPTEVNLSIVTPATEEHLRKPPVPREPTPEEKIKKFTQGG